MIRGTWPHTTRLSETMDLVLFCSVLKASADCSDMCVSNWESPDNDNELPGASVITRSQQIETKGEGGEDFN